MHELNHVGVLTLELFDTQNGLYANETAPRVHNSGHWSIEGAVSSQFENHMRAVAGLPLGSTEAIRPSAMINIIGQHPDTSAILAIPGHPICRSLLLRHHQGLWRFVEWLVDTVCHFRSHRVRLALF